MNTGDSDSSVHEMGNRGVVIPVAFGTGRGDARGRLGDSRIVPGQPSRSSMVDPSDDELDAELTARQRRFVEGAAWMLADELYDAIE